MPPTDSPSDMPSAMPSPYPRIEVVTVNATNAGTAAVGLNACQGVCRGNTDCSDGLFCYRRNLGEQVPYCIFDDDSIQQSALFLDFCTLPPTPDPTMAPTLKPTLDPTQAPTLRPTPLPTTRGPTPWPTPGKPKNAIVQFLGNPPPRDLNRCEGDCDSDSDCEGDLICYQRGSNDQVPGCTFSSMMGSFPISDDTDVCVDRRSLGNVVRLRLHWEDGYYWQESSREVFWCMAHSQSGTCHYGTEARECTSDRIYTDWCSGTSRQKFQIVYLLSGEFMIRAVSNGKCLEGDRPKLRDCDPNKSSQRWHPMNGGYESPSFEITRVGKESRCLSQHHHPKEGEIIELNDCAQERRYETNAWEFY